MNRAFIFPGQGSQSIGMGKDFFDSEPVAQQVFKTVDKILGYSLSDIIFYSSEQELALTTNTQPAIMATSIAILELLLHKSRKNINELCRIVAGHSLGEYSALCANGSIRLEDAAKLLKIRARSMQEASPKGEGSMAACIGIEYSILCKLINDVVLEGVCQVANDNVNGQIVISGHEYNINMVIDILKDTGYRAIKLNVSAPFHSNLMKPAELAMKSALLDTNFTHGKIPIISNITADSEIDITKIKANLIDQICGTVRWRETMDKLAAIGVTELVEIGPGKVLTGLAKKSPYNFIVHNISTLEELERFLQVL